MRVKFILFGVLFLIAGFSSAQVLHPAKWATSVGSEKVKVGDQVELIFKAGLENAWHLYSSDFDPECGPMVMTYKFKPNSSYALEGNIKPIGAILEHDKNFGCDVKLFKDKAEFRQKIKVLSSPLRIEGTYEYQVCSDIDGKCIVFDDDFTFDKFTVTGSTKTSGSTVTSQASNATDAASAKIENGSSTSPTGAWSVTSGDDSTSSNKTPTIGSSAIASTAVAGECKGPVLDKSILEGESSIDQKSLVGYLFFAFIVGLTSLITPCVFPMIPMTVTFFLKDNQTRRQGIKKAIIFGISIIVIYTAAGTLFAVLLGTDGLNALATHWAPNLFVFVIFIVFALSFFGLFEINAPYQLVNKVDSQAEKGGLIGIFFMAATLVLVSFSCTVPIVGSVLFLAANGEIIKPILAMFFYALAFAIPFTLFAIFPQAIKSLPKSGGWLNSVKVTLGFLELALCLKFFSIADQAYHWGLLDRDINIALWIVIFSLLGLYLLGKITLPHDSPVEKVGVPRLVMVIAVFTFVVYLIPGLVGAPLKMLAGYLPPKHTLDFDLVAEKTSAGNTICDEPKYADFLHLPHGLNGYFDYCQALECARKQNKPIFIDFTGHGCTNCREMEAIVWSDPAVLQRLQNDFVMVALYVDDKTELPEKEWVTSKYDGKVKKTLGKKNADIQIANLENNAQPYYVLLGPDEKVLAWPYPYNTSPEKFVAFLESGKSKYKQLYSK